MRIAQPLALGRRDDFADPLLRADVAGIDAQARGAGVRRLERALVVEVDVGNDRHARGANDLLQCRCRFGRRAGNADDVRACILAAANLVDRRLGVLGRRVGHGLDADRRVSTHGHGADHDLPRLSPLDIAPGTDGHDSAYRRFGGVGKTGCADSLGLSHCVNTVNGNSLGAANGQACPIAWIRSRERRACPRAAPADPLLRVPELQSSRQGACRLASPRARALPGSKFACRKADRQRSRAAPADAHFSR